jgi:hypothetical protein
MRKKTGDDAVAKVYGTGASSRLHLHDVPVLVYIGNNQGRVVMRKK